MKRWISRWPAPFLEVSASGSFISAAERLHLTQTAVSARIRTLEEQLERRLFVRNGRAGILMVGLRGVRQTTGRQRYRPRPAGAAGRRHCLGRTARGPRGGLTADSSRQQGADGAGRVRVAAVTTLVRLTKLVR
ncbi:LysR family transcriptional regulator [Paraburkholderia atlantica]|uniref:LysR family transcriptional regulator n=1 Tax=Paraburkholderia atlantica TaxID=2654982 RepID=UPI003B75CED4